MTQLSFLEYEAKILSNLGILFFSKTLIADVEIVLFISIRMWGGGIVEKKLDKLRSIAVFEKIIF